MGLRGEAGFVEDGKQEVAGAVAGEGAAGAVGAVRAGGEAECEYAGMRIAEGGNGFAPIVPIGISAAANTGNFCAVGTQARASIAGDDLRVQSIERGCGGRRHKPILRFTGACMKWFRCSFRVPY